MESCSVEEISKTFGASDKLLYQLRDELEDWLKLQPHLPQGASRRRLESFVLGTKMSLEVAKQRLDRYYTVRGLVPEFFANRDPRAGTAFHDVAQYAWLPKLSPEKYAVAIFRALINDPGRTDPSQILKYMFMTNDIQMVECRSAGQIMVYDLSMLSLGHLKILTPTFLKKSVVALKAYPLRIKEIHYINTPPFVDRLVSIMKAILPPKIAARIQVHPIGDLTSLHRSVPRSILPKDYGGDHLTMNELSALWRGKLDEWREWFLEQEKMIVIERLRPGSAIDEDSHFGFSGSFRKLDVD